MRVFAQKPALAKTLSVTSTPPRAVRDVLSSPGHALDAADRQHMETRFRHDFGDVRVHSDRRAAQSAEVVSARAYAVGRNIVFGPGEYAPGTARGRALIAHELAHVVQHDQAADPAPVLRRAAKPAKTWAGEFIADPYDATLAQVGSLTVGYGADVTITFKANKFVDADKIAFVQTALSVKDGQVHNKYQGDENVKKTAESRAIPTGKPGEGVHIDQKPEIVTPLYGMSGSRGSELADAVPAAKLTTIGWHHPGATGPSANQDATMHDEPDLTSGDAYTSAESVLKREWHQHFETSALAIEGNQKGMYYGTVEWGWSKSVSDANPHVTDFKPKSENVPSAIFMEAARLWNVSQTSDGEDTIDLPLDTPTIQTKAVLWDGPDKRKKLADLAKGTRVGRMAQKDPKNRSGWTGVIVISGAHVGKTGWIAEGDLVAR